MGYYTAFSMETDKPENLWLIQEFRKYSIGADYAVDLDGEYTDTTKWYKWKDEAIEFSKLYPDILFCISGEGEESGDIWKAYFQNGKHQICQARIVFDPYDISKMI